MFVTGLSHLIYLYFVLITHANTHTRTRVFTIIYITVPHFIYLANRNGVYLS
jgi:hypothetical protein